MKQNTTYKKLILLISIFVIGFISLVTVNYFFTDLINKLDQKTTNLKAKLTIEEFIEHDILKIRSQFHELATSTSSEISRELIISDITKNINMIEKSLYILENGGKLEREILLNIAGHLNTTKTIEYHHNASDKFSLKTIDIKLNLKDIKEKLIFVETLLKNREFLKKQKDLKKYVNSTNEIKRYYKTLPAYFNRISENLNRLLYEGELELTDIKNIIKQDKERYMLLKMYLILFVIVIVVVFGYIIVKQVYKDSKDIFRLNCDLNQTLINQKKQEKSNRAILDTQPNIIIVSNGTEMLDSNMQLIKFFNQYNSFEEFTKENQCICDFFEDKVPNDDYIVKKDYDGLNWSDYILNNPEKNFKVIMKKDGIKNHFSILVKKIVIDEISNEIVMIITLNNITQEINSQIKLKALNDNLEFLIQNKTKELQELNENLEQKIIIETTKVREKDKQMIQQSRFAAMGEMIGNIAHQWRQPLSAINTTSSGMHLQMQLGLASNEEIVKSYSKIMGYVDFLSQTIEDFRGFFKEDKETSDFNVIDTLEKSLTISTPAYKDNEITIIKDYKEVDLLAHGMPSELSQVFLNILNNAKDATISNGIENRYVNICSTIENKMNVVYIQDNAGGIPKDIIDKIFDPYFTTKHQSQGTGIGLYMSKDIIEKNMNGRINVKNRMVTLDGISYNGACFKIEIPIV
ncbi:MAG: ATP-binding protein [Campylobacterota bacterium]|nr:ATP-binding protein [Campylobacterota bacterium]